MELLKKSLQVFSLFAFFSLPSKAMPALGDALPVVEIDGEKGGLTDGGKWSSEMIKNHLWLVFYVDPDHKDDNATLEKALKKENFPPTKLGSIAVINMAATWLPDAVLKPALESKQKDYPTVVYVLDRKKIMLEKWGLMDDTYNVLLVNKDAKILYVNHGVLNTKAIDDLIQVIRNHIPSSDPTAK